MRSAKRRRNRALRRRSAGAHTALSCSPDRTLLYWNRTGIAGRAVLKTAWRVLCRPSRNEARGSPEEIGEMVNEGNKTSPLQD